MLEIKKPVKVRGKIVRTFFSHDVGILPRVQITLVCQNPAYRSHSFNQMFSFFMSVDVDLRVEAFFKKL